MAPAIRVMGRGASGALGLSLRHLALAMRAQQLELRRTPFVDRDGAPVLASFATSIDTDCRGDDRLVVLLAAAIVEATRGGQRRRAAPAPPLVIAAVAPCGAAGSVSMEEADRRMLAALAAALPAGIDPRSRVLRAGHAGFAWALREARTLLREGTSEVVVAAASTPLDEAAVAAFDAAGRLVGDERRGRVLGEAGAALVLGAGPPAARDAARSARLAEAEHDAAGPSAAGAVGRMLRRMRGALEVGAIDLVIVDLNGEEARATAWEADVEAAASALQDVDVEAWPDLLGDLGPATGAVAAAVILELAEIGAISRTNAIVALRGDDGATGALAFELPGVRGTFAASVERAVPRALGPAPADAASAPARAQAGQMARSLFEDLAAMGLLLAPGEAGPDRQSSARRLLDVYDALGALGVPEGGRPAALDVLGAMEAWVAEVDPPDRGRRFVATFLRAHLTQVGGLTPVRGARRRPSR